MERHSYVVALEAMMKQYPEDRFLTDLELAELKRSMDRRRTNGDLPYHTA